MKAQDLKSFDPELLLQELRAWESQEAEDKGNGTSTLNGPNFGARYNLCQDEPFRNQPTIAFCSGFLVDPSIVATAAHCVDNDNLNTVRFVFGFEMINSNTAKNTIDNDEIYRGIRILGARLVFKGPTGHWSSAIARFATAGMSKSGEVKRFLMVQVFM